MDLAPSFQCIPWHLP